MLSFFCPNSGVDPGFPIREGANPRVAGGTRTCNFAKKSQKLHAIEKLLVSWGYPGFDPRPATAINKFSSNIIESTEFPGSLLHLSSHGPKFSQFWSGFSGQFYEVMCLCPTRLYGESFILSIH